MMDEMIAPPAATGAPMAEGRPLTLAQRRIWSLAQIGTESVLGHQLMALRLRGPLRMAALIGALALLERRHAVLRTRFLSHAGSHITQHVEGDAVLALETVDLDGFTGEQILVETARRLDDESRHGFDLGVDAPGRALLFRFADADHVLALSVHALIGDPPTLRILAGDLLAAYTALARGSVPALPPLPQMSSADPALEQPGGHAANAGKALAYWRALLSDKEVATFPAAKARGDASAHAPAQQRVRLGAARSAALRRLGRQLEVPVPTLFLTALHLLLARYDRGSASRVGVVDDHHRPPGVAGRLQNIVPSQLRADGATRFADAARQVAGEMVAAIDHHIPFELLAQQHPGELVPVLFEWRASLPLRALDLDIELLRDATPRTDADIVVLVTEQADGELELAIVHMSERFGDRTIERAALHLLRILDAAIADASIRLRDITLIDGAELELLSRPYDGPTTFDERPVHRLIAAQAQRRAEATAIIFGDLRWTHGELERRANRLAHRLLALGLEPEQRAAVALPRSPEAIVAILAVLKAGGAFVPVDSDHPASRNHHILADAGVRIVVTSSGRRAKLPEGLNATLVEIDGPEADALPDTDPGVDIDPGQLAYVIYTSGSTGLPKGVAVEHGVLTRHLQATAAIYEMSEESLELPFLPFSSDGGHERWMVPLMVGGGIVLPEQALLTPAETFALMRRHGVNNASLPTTYLQQLAEWAARTGESPPMRLYSFGGEGLPKATFDLLRRSLHADWLINGYGPTETVMTPMVWKIRADAAFTGTYAPIGRAVGLRRTYVLDADMNPVPIGVVGEIHLGGDGVARGYVGRPDLTADRFVPDPFGAGGGRLYRSGDLGRWLEDGTVEFMGRVDHQVKLRGFRIELGEIEAALGKEPGVSEAVVVLRRNAEQEALVGYVVPDAGMPTVDSQALRQALARKLPEYMVPSAIVALERLPLNANSKLDRAALPAPQPVDVELAPPAPGLESDLATIWQDVLGLPAVGADQNFFDLGGHSMAALRVLARLRELRPDSAIGIADLFNHLTIRDLAHHIEHGRTHRGGETVRLRREGSRPMLYCFPGLLVSTREYLKLVEYLGHDQPATGFICYSLSDGGRLSQSVEAITARYAEEVRRACRGRSCTFLGWSWGGLLAYEAARMLADDVEVRLIGMVDVCAMDATFAQGAVPHFAPGEREAWQRRIDDWLQRASMRKDWERLLAAMDPLAHDQFLRFAGTSADELPTDGPGLNSRERIFWVLIDNALVFRRYKLMPHDRPIQAWAAGDSLNRGLEIIDWRRYSRRASAAEIVPGTTHFDIIGAPAFHGRFARRLDAALQPGHERLEQLA